jgi:hypothetical protein
MGATAEALRDAWGEELPAILAALADRQDETGGVACDFELSPRAQGQVAAALDLDEAAVVGALRMFGRDGMHSLYGLWLVEGGAPVVYVSGEGVGTGVIAASLDDFLVLLAAGKDSIGWVDQWSDGECEGVAEYRAWLREALGRAAPHDPQELVEAGRTGSPSFAAWVQEHRA